MGQWSKATCNHWISKEALVQYICTQAEDQPFRMRCPVCAVARCDRCTLHSTNPRDEGCCCIPPRQIRAVLSEDQMARCDAHPGERARPAPVHALTAWCACLQLCACNP